MIRYISRATILFVIAASASAVSAQERPQPPHHTNDQLDSLIARHAAANNVPESLVRRIIRRESRGNPRAVSKGNYGLMQIRLGTARSLGYRGSAAGLLDPDTNMTYAVKYLAGAYHTAGGNADRAVHYYSAGYYYAAKRKRMLDTRSEHPKKTFATAPASRRSSAARQAHAPLESNPAAQKKKVEKARANGTTNVATSSNLYTGKLDLY